MSRPLPALVALTLFVAAPVIARESAFQTDPEPVRPTNIQEGTEWKEGTVALPAWPADSDLTEWTPDNLESPFRFFIDTRHISVDKAGAVVRYILVAQAPSGTRNVSFEGIRCTLKGAYRVYAYGSGGHFVRSPPTDWQPLPTQGSEAYRLDLFRNRFCVPKDIKPRRPDQIDRALHDRSSNREVTGFQTD
jgi:hypothetical protein